MQQLSAQDASFVYLETPHTPMHIGSVGIYDPSTAPGGFVRFKDILAFIQQRLGGARSFRQRLVRVPFDLDHPYWIEDPEFDIEFHVRHIALPKPGDWRQLCIQVARLHSRPMDLTKPLWEFTIVEGLDNIEGLPKGCFALVSKVHHAAIDGMSGVEMSAAVHDLDASMTKPDKPDDWKPESMPRVAELLSRSYFNSLIQPMRVMETIGRSLPGMGRLASQVGKGDVSVRNARPAPKTRFNGKVSAHRAWDAVPFPLADIRAIKEAVPDATVNDVILAIVGGALRQYLKGGDDLPKDTLTAMAPISVRGEGEKAAMGNLVSAMVVGLGTQIEDPLERLRFVHDEAVNSKALTSAVGARTLTDYSQLMPSALAGLAARLYTRIRCRQRACAGVQLRRHQRAGQPGAAVFRGCTDGGHVRDRTGVRRYGPDQYDLQLWRDDRDLLHRRSRCDARSAGLCRCVARILRGAKGGSGETSRGPAG